MGGMGTGARLGNTTNLSLDPLVVLSLVEEAESMRLSLMWYDRNSINVRTKCNGDSTGETTVLEAAS